MFAAAIVLAGALVGTAVQAQPMQSNMTEVCGQEARRQKLTGTPLTDFLTACWNRGRPAAPMVDLNQRCEDEAGRRTLSGEAKVSFMRSCNAGQVPLPPMAGGMPSCEDQAAQLSGEQKVAFVRDCMARGGR
jgi:hypothetical protein